MLLSIVSQATVDVMKKYVEDNKLEDRVFVPNDGEILKL